MADQKQQLDWMDPSSIKRLLTLGGGAVLGMENPAMAKLTVISGLVYTGLSYVREMFADYKEIRIAEAQAAGRAAAEKVTTGAEAFDVLTGAK